MRGRFGGPALLIYNAAMTLDALIILTGVIVATLPFLGFPRTWLQVIFFIAGIVVVVLGIIVRRRLSQKSRTQPLSFDEQP